MRKATVQFPSTPQCLWISIPAFREEGDDRHIAYTLKQSVFQSPPSVRKATVAESVDRINSLISIPAFREEGDFKVDDIATYAAIISIPAFREEGDQ